MTSPNPNSPTLDRIIHISIGGDLAVTEVESASVSEVTYELREDGGFELREDGSFELREAGN